MYLYLAAQVTRTPTFQPSFQPTTEYEKASSPDSDTINETRNSDPGEMDLEETFVMSRSRAPSFIDVTSSNEKMFEQLPDLIQEAAVSTECKKPYQLREYRLMIVVSSQRLRISRVYNNPAAADSHFMTQPMFFITSRTDSGIDLPDLHLTDEKLLGKYGLDLTANFADIRAYGAKAFFQKENPSNGSTYSICACMTGYIWVSVSVLREAKSTLQFSNLELQIGTFSLKSKAITTVEIPFLYKYFDGESKNDGKLSEFCATVLAKYLRLRTMGQQYEEAAEKAIHETRQELSPLRVVDPGKYDDLRNLLQRICINAPLPPTSDVSLISRKMITKRWECWREGKALRTRYYSPRRIVQCFRRSPHDSIDLLSNTFAALRSTKTEIQKTRQQA